MPDRLKQKWRPPLPLVLGGTLAAVLCLPLIGIAYFKVAGNILGWGETAWMIGWMAVISTLVLAFLLWRLVLRPIRSLIAHADAVKDGRSTTPPDHFGTPELTALAQAVVDMGAVLQDREAGIRAYSDHVTHEMKSPLTSITAAAELLDGPLDDADRARLILSIQDASTRMQSLLDALRRLAAAREPLDRGPVRLSEIAEVLPTRSQIDIRVEGDGLLPFGTKEATAILVQMAQNSHAHGATELWLKVQDNALFIHDNGRGIAAGDRDRVFDPFFTTRREQGGTGMGLAVVRTMLQASGGRIELLDSNQGAAFKIIFRDFS